ncbi:MAG TPA: efflux RND transporter periplasmic adaptor subunit, partial [Tepidisphaeraceae bacterium]
MQHANPTIARDHGARPGNGNEACPDAFGACKDGHEHDEELIPKDLPRPSNLTVLVAVIVFVLLLAALFVIGFIPHHRERKIAEADAHAQATATLAVQVVRPAPSDGGKMIQLPSDVKANQDTLIFPRTNGYLKKLYVDVQDRVKEGQLLAEIDTPEVDAQLNQSRANLEQFKAAVVKADADLVLAQRTLARFESAQKNQPGSVTEQEVDEKRATAAQMQSAVASAKANVVAAQADVQRLTVLQGFQKVVAPFAGTIAARNFDVGALLSSSNTARELFRITQSDVMRVFVNVPQDDATKIKVGQPAFLAVRNYPGREFKGTVARSSGAIDMATRTLSLELHFPNPQGDLLAGMYGSARMEVSDSNKPLLTIPTSTLVFNAEGLRVAVVDQEGKVRFQKITTGRDLGTRIEVMSGVSDGDRIVDNPGERLAEGSE